MTLPLSLKLILEGISNSKRLLDMAEAEDWELFLELEAQRYTSLIDLKLEAVGPTAEQYVEIHSRMNELIDLNDRIEIVCRRQRSDLVEQLKEFKKGAKAHKAYSA